MEGLRHQKSQGAANWTIDPGDRFTFYRLVDSVVPSTVGKDGHEKSFFDGIDTTLPGLARDSDMKRLQIRELQRNCRRLPAQASLRLRREAMHRLQLRR